MGIPLERRDFQLFLEVSYQDSVVSSGILSNLARPAQSTDSIDISTTEQFSNKW